jgi:DNA-directed RNA polymerase specialized sigma24 family protein
MADDANPAEPSLSEMPPEEPARALCAEASLQQLWEQWDDSERQRVLGLARAAENALKRFWRQEHRYYSHMDGLMVINEEGEWAEWEGEDAHAMEVLEAIMEQLCGEQMMEWLWGLLDAAEQSILAGLMEGKTQKEIADGLEVTQSAVAHRLQKIRAKVRESQGDAMRGSDDCS